MTARADHVGRKESVLVAAPFGHDADILAAVAARAGAPWAVLRDVEPGWLERACVEGVAALVLTQEVLTEAVIEALGRFLGDQPAWSNPPLILLVEDDGIGIETARRLRAARPDAVLNAVIRPVSLPALEALVANALATRRAQRELFAQIAAHQKAEQRTRFWLREANHRVKNMLATITALARMSQAAAPDPEEAFVSFEARLQALTRVDAMLSKADAMGDGLTFATMARTVLGPYRASGKHEVNIQTPGIPLQRDAAHTLALCLNELTTNAIKYGALSGAEGRIGITLSRPTVDRVELRWVERGGPPVTPPTRTGFGTQYLQGALEMLFEGPPVLRFGVEGFELSVAGPATTLFRPPQEENGDRP